jgi:NAD(P)-dependent dehydrogenase (short-subunit alcohol dehydrogenase family)
MTETKTIRTFDGAVAIITGGASGIGAALGRELARRGTEVVLADRQVDLAEQAAALIRGGGGKATAAELNVTEYSAVEALVWETVNRTGRLDYMFNNAGIAISGPAAAHRIEDWDATIDVNLRGVVNGVQAAYQVMREQGCGHIVNTASLAGLIIAPGNASYTATKHAVVGLSKTLRVEAASEGIRVSVLCPGFIRTPILDCGGKYGKELVEYSPQQRQKIKQFIENFKPMPPDVFAVEAVNAVGRNEAIIIIPRRSRFMWWFDRMFPDWNLRMVTKQYQSLLE